MARDFQLKQVGTLLLLLIFDKYYFLDSILIPIPSSERQAQKVEEEVEALSAAESSWAKR